MTDSIDNNISIRRHRPRRTLRDKARDGGVYKCLEKRIRLSQRTEHRSKVPRTAADSSQKKDAVFQSLIVDIYHKQVVVR